MFPTTNDLLEKQIAIIIEQRSLEASPPTHPLGHQPRLRTVFPLHSQALSELLNLPPRHPKLPNPGKEPLSEGVTVGWIYQGSRLITSRGPGPVSFAYQHWSLHQCVPKSGWRNRDLSRS